MDLDHLLNEKQKEAATYLDGHIRIIAGAGSGKTRVVTYRIAYLIEEIGIHPSNILAITFTNKAANEMKERVENILGSHALGSTICTIHSMCVRVLRAHASLLGYPHNFIIMDEEDQKALIKKIFKENNIDSKTITVKSMIHYISSYKTALIKPKRAMKLAGNIEGEMLKANVYNLYEKYNKEHNMMDFDDLLVNTLEIFQDHEEVVEKWSRRYQYVHVDEFQDVGEIEYALIHYFGLDSIVCVVGDPDQTIYSFRGSDVNYILNFDKDYDNVKTVILDQNYRSTKTILDISNNLIRKNRNRLEKDLFTQGEEGCKVTHYSGSSEQDEASFIVNKIEDEVTNGNSYKDYLILYRANYLSRPIEQMLIKNNIPYRIFGGLKFFNRKEVKDALSYIRLVVNHDDLSFERVVNTPSRGVGNKTLERINLASINNQFSLYEALCFCADEIKLTGKAKKELQNFVSAIEKAKSSIKAPEDVFEDLMKDSGYMQMLKNNQEESRIENIMELKNSISQYMKENPDTANFDSYLQDIALYTSTDDLGNDDYVSLMSIHMAKGLEYDHVFVCGLSENIFPSLRSIEEGGDDGLEEERRLAYVAFTRAKKTLYLTDSQGFSFVSQSPKLTSRFVGELGNNLVEHVGKPSKFKTENYINMNESKADMIGNNNVDTWSVGDFAVHEKFGKGVVVKVGENSVDIAFSMPHGIISLMPHHKMLKKLVN